MELQSPLQSQEVHLRQIPVVKLKELVKRCTKQCIIQVLACMLAHQVTISNFRFQEV